MDRVAVSLLAYATVLVQVGLLAVWPLWGAVPHLIALGTVVFILRREPRLGLWWIGVGGVLTDLLLPLPVGSTTACLLLAFLLATLLLRHVVSDVSWWVALILGGLLVAVAELPLVLVSGEWWQYLRDVLVASVLTLPIVSVTHRVQHFRRVGLQLPREYHVDL